MADLGLRLLLWLLGTCIAVGSRFMPSLRSQITKTMTFEVSAGKNVARHWNFDAPRRRAVTKSGRAVVADCSLHFESSRFALRALVSRHTVDRVVEGMQRGTVEIQGSTFVVLWFHGLTRKFVKLGRPSGPRGRLPHAYLAHDPAASGRETIIREPAVSRLDPAWTAAWRARSTLYQVRAATDEPMPEP